MSNVEPAKTPDRPACLVPLAPGMVPRKWQEECMIAIREALPKHQKILVSAATGTGKGSMIGSMAVKVAMSGKRLLFLVHRDELIDDVMSRARLYYPDIKAGKVRGKVNEVHYQIVFASVQSLHKNRLPTLGHFDFVITDEAHHATARSYLNIYKRVEEVNPKWKHIGFTATPFRSAGEGKTEGLGKAFEKLVYEYPLIKAIEDGALCPIRGIAVKTDLDLTGVDPEDEEALEKVVDTPSRNRIVAEKYHELIPGRQAICFGVTVAHAQHLAAAFVEIGVVAEAVWGGDKQRDQKIARYKAGTTKVLTNCGLLTEGFDAPQTAAVILVRPTGSIGLYSQMVGRATRLYPGKAEGLVIDFVGNTGKYQIVALHDMTTPVDTPRIKPGDEVRFKRRPGILTRVVRVRGFINRQEEGEATTEFEPDRWVPASELLHPVVRGEPEEMAIPVAIGANHWPVSLFGKSQTLWYCYEDSKGKKTFVAKGRGVVGLLRKVGETWEAWRRVQRAADLWEAPEQVKVGTFAECSEALPIQVEAVDRAWMGQPASEAQMAALKKFKVRRLNLTKGEAAQIMEIKIFQLEIEKKGDA
jgi:superfamily II DNA or RNA helicase